MINLSWFSASVGTYLLALPGRVRTGDRWTCWHLPGHVGTELALFVGRCKLNPLFVGRVILFNT